MKVQQGILENKFCTCYSIDRNKDGGTLIKTMAIFATDDETDIRMLYDPVPSAMLPTKPDEDGYIYRVHTPYYFNIKDVDIFNQADHQDYTTIRFLKTGEGDIYSISIRIPHEMFLQYKLGYFDTLEARSLM